MSTLSTVSRRAFMAGALSLSVALGAVLPATAQDETAIRVLSIDGDTGSLTVLDGRSGAITGQFTGAANGPAFAVGSDSGQYFITNFYTGEKTVIVNSGIAAEPHGDHVDLIEGPAFVQATLDASSPAHYWAHDGILAVANDGNGTVTIIDEERLGEGVTPTTIELTTEPDHTSIAVLGETLFIGNYTGGEVQAYSLDGTLLIEDVATCPGTHGETLIGDRLAFACDDGLLLISEDGSSEHVPYPTGEGTEATPVSEAPLRANILTATADSSIIAGDSPAGVLLFDVDADSSQLIPASAPILFVQYSSDGDIVTAIDTEGTVHGIDPTAGTIVWSTTATTPFSSFSADEANTFFPFLANAGGMAFVADPGTGEVVAIDARTGEVTNRFEIGGRPARVAVVEVSGISH